ncbi:MAG TPA: GNAT family N-acetyltransferase [Sphingomicrobium sp.]|nr:GNAT family N-acetyltransferase [Sphingomicrobium sp.]
MRTEAPVIETDRLILRPFRKEDLDAHAATLGDEEVMRHIGGKPLNREDSWRRLMSGVGSWALIGMGPWAVERKSDGGMVGHCGFFQFERDMSPLILREPEMGWIFHRSVHGQGIAFEACHAALAWAEREIAAPSYPAIIDLENAPSIKLARRLGFLREPDGIYRGAPIAVFRRPGKLGA